MIGQSRKITTSIIIFILSSIQLSSCCVVTNSCTCINSETLGFTIYKCRNKEYDVTIKHKLQDYTKIHCNNLEYNLDMFPDMNTSFTPNMWITNCIHPNFSEIATKFNANKEQVYSIIFKGDETNYSQPITKDFFIGFPNLTSITIESALIQNESDLFIHFLKLSSLHLTGNNLSHGLPDNFFASLWNLGDLELPGNNIVTLKANIFGGLYKLTQLDLKYNKISVLPKGIFNDLVNLVEINLRNNKIVTLESDTFYFNPMLTSVYMNDNPGLTLPDFLLENKTKLWLVNINNCELKRIPQDIFKGSTYIKELYLNSNNIKILSKYFFDGLKFIKKVDLSSTNIDLVPEIESEFLETIHLDYNPFKKVNRSSFKRFQKLATLYMSYNELEELSEDAFMDLKLLKYVTLNNNRLKFIPKFCDKLETIYLRGNVIEEVPKDWLLAYPNIQKIDLSYNRIVFLDISTFLVNIKLSHYTLKPYLEVDVSDNNFKVISFERFLMRNQSQLNNYYKYGADTLILLYNTTIHCDCYIKNLLRFINKEMDQNLWNKMKITYDLMTCSNFKNTYAEDIDPSSLPCPFEHGCPQKCTCEWNINQLIIVNCSNEHMSVGPKIDHETFRDSHQYIFLYDQIIVDLSNNQLEEAPDEKSGYEVVTTLNLSYNMVKNINWLPSNIEVLRLDHNEISTLTEAVFKNLLSLQILSVQHNKITLVHPNIFSNLPKLTELYLSYNKLRFMFDHETDGCKNLEIVDLSFNFIREFSQHLLRKKTRLSLVNLTHNNLHTLKLSDFRYGESYNLTIDFSQNNFTSIDMKELTLYLELNQSIDHNNQTNSTIIVILNNCTMKCDCQIYDLVQSNQNLYDTVQTKFKILQNNLVCSNYTSKHSLQVQDINPLELSCPVSFGCPEKCFCEWKPHDQSIVVNCSNQNLVTIPKIQNEFFKKNYSFPFVQTKVDLSRNNLNMTPDGESGYENVTTLILSNNSLNNISWIPSNLKVLHLDHNNINILDRTIIKNLKNKSMHLLSLVGNPWKCDCDAFELQMYLTKFAETVNQSEVMCMETNTLLVDLILLCENDENPITLISTISPIFVILLLLIVNVTIYYRYEKRIKIYLYSRNLCLWFVTEEDIDKDKTYDVFLCYSHQDEQLVVTEILPELEKPPYPYKVCVHIRDWTPGEFITKQVIDSVRESRRTMIILSKNFVESIWCKMEFQTAHAQALDDGLARIIVVIYGELDEGLLDDDLKAYLSTNTYVKWGDPWFWRKIKYALPHIVRKK